MPTLPPAATRTPLTWSFGQAPGRAQATAHDAGRQRHRWRRSGPPWTEQPIAPPQL